LGHGREKIQVQLPQSRHGAGLAQIRGGPCTNEGLLSLLPVSDHEGAKQASAVFAKVLHARESLPQVGTHTSCIIDRPSPPERSCSPPRGVSHTMASHWRAHWATDCMQEHERPRLLKQRVRSCPDKTTGGNSPRGIFATPLCGCSLTVRQVCTDTAPAGIYVHTGADVRVVEG